MVDGCKMVFNRIYMVAMACTGFGKTICLPAKKSFCTGTDICSSVFHYFPWSFNLPARRGYSKYCKDENQCSRPPFCNYYRHYLRILTFVFYKFKQCSDVNNVGIYRLAGRKRNCIVPEIKI